MHYKVTHTTRYTYYEAVSLCHNIARLIPRSTDKQVCRSAVLEIYPAPDILDEYEDFFGNKVTYFAIQHEHKSLTVTVSSEIVRTNPGTLEFSLYENTPWEAVKEQLYSLRPVDTDILQYIPETQMTQASPEILEYALRSFTPGRPLFEAARDLMQRIYENFEFEPGFTTVTTPLSLVMKERKGVCQDFAHLAIACIRSVGLAARYVSGYIETIPPEGTEKLTGVDASHAWFALYVPGSGWIDFDPTNNQLPADQYLTIGWGRDYSDIVPLKGVIVSSGPHRLSVSVDVRRVNNNAERPS
ncbi:MAG: transglutaminase family protein [Puia sp.]|nr:transglutaminase family protein [Puia sp.]